MNEIHKKIIITIEKENSTNLRRKGTLFKLKFAAETSKDVSVDASYSNKLQIAIVSVQI